MKVLRFVVDYWYIPLLALGAVLGWVFVKRFTSGPSLPPIKQILDEVSAIGAQREAREIELQMGAEQAKQHVRDKYNEKLKRLDAEAKLKVKELEDDPAALAKYLDALAESVPIH